MPSSMFSSDTMTTNRALEEQRAIEVAYNLHALFLNDNDCLNNHYEANTNNEHRGKKSQNTTECVPVPSSEHVAEIVGRQGCKIKALRAKTNTYIKTPVRGDEPVFVVTGRKEDVSAAKREILSAADHFSQIRAQRKSSIGTGGSLPGSLPGPNSALPGQTTLQVRVPYRVVGLVVGPKGATIKRIQQTTNTYIVTPSRDKEPVFEVTGLPDNVECAKKEIEAHIAMRTGSCDSASDSPYNNLNALQDSLLRLQAADLSAFSSFSGFHDVDEGLGDSPTFESASSVSTWPDVFDVRATNNPAPPLNLLHDLLDPPGSRGGGGVLPSSTTDHSLEGLLGGLSFFPTGQEGGGTPPLKPLLLKGRDCVVCFESEIVAALVPCGHNNFCMECAQRVVDSNPSACPVCCQPASHAMRIYN